MNMILTFVRGSEVEYQSYRTFRVMLTKISVDYEVVLFDELSFKFQKYYINYPS